MAGAGGIQEHPLGAVRTVDAKRIARVETEVDEAGAEVVAETTDRAVGEPLVGGSGGRAPAEVGVTVEGLHGVGVEVVDGPDVVQGGVRVRPEVRDAGGVASGDL